MEIRELDNEIRSGLLKKVYFFYGEETFLLENKINSIKKRVVSPEFEELCFSKFEGKDASLDAFEEEFSSYPFMADKKLILVKNTGWFQNLKSKEFIKIKELFKDIPDYLYVIIEEDTFDEKKVKSLDFIGEIGGTVRFETLTVNQLSLWVTKMFEEKEKQVSSKDVLYIITASGQSMGKIYSEVNKLITFSGEEKKIKSEDVYDIVTKSTEYKIYELFDDIIEYRSHKAAEKLKALLDAKEKPTVIISGIMSRIAEILIVKHLNCDGFSKKEISSYFDYPRPDFVIQKMITKSKGFKEDYLKKAIKKGLYYDRTIKMGKIDAALASEMYVSELVAPR